MANTFVENVNIVAAGMEVLSVDQTDLNALLSKVGIIAGVTNGYITYGLPTSATIGDIAVNTLDGGIYRFEVVAPSTTPSWLLVAQSSSSTGGTSSAPPVTTVSGLPTIGTNGEIVFNQADGYFYGYINGSWVTMIATPTATDVVGIEVFATDPTAGNFEGRTIFNTTDNQLKKYTNGVFVQVVEPTTAAQSVADGSITTAKFAAGIKPIEVVDTLPLTALSIGRIVFLTTDAKLYRYSAGGWITAIPASDITGTITGTQIGTDTITAANIATNAITSAEISAGAITAGKIATNSIDAGMITAGAIGATQIAANAIVADKIAAGAITSTKIAALSVDATKITAGAISADKLAVNSVTAGAIAAGSISASHLAARTITANQIATGTLTANELAAYSVTASKVAAGTIFVGTGIQSSDFTDGLNGVGFRLKSAAAGNSSDPTIFGGYIRGAKLEAGLIKKGSYIYDTDPAYFGVPSVYNPIWFDQQSGLNNTLTTSTPIAISFGLTTDVNIPPRIRVPSTTSTVNFSGTQSIWGYGTGTFVNGGITYTHVVTVSFYYTVYNSNGIIYSDNNLISNGKFDLSTTGVPVLFTSSFNSTANITLLAGQYVKIKRTVQDLVGDIHGCSFITSISNM